MNFDLDKAIATISQNFTLQEILQDDTLHHYVWWVGGGELERLIRALRTQYVCVASSLESAIPTNERYEVMVDDHNFLVVQVGLQQVLFSTEKSQYRAELLRCLSCSY